MLGDMSSVEFLEWQTRALLLTDVEKLRAQGLDYETAYRAVFTDKD